MQIADRQQDAWHMQIGRLPRFDIRDDNGAIHAAS
jgi:hypothetical protein